MKKKLLKDSWFQMFTAIAGVAYVVSALGTASTRHGAAPASPPAAVPEAAKPVAAPAPAAAAAPSGIGAQGPITPSPRSSSDLATYSGASPASAFDPGAPPAPPGSAAGANPGAPPRMTITGTGVGNTQGIVGVSGGGMGAINGLLSSLMGIPQAARAPAATGQAAAAALPPLFRVAPSRPGIFTVGPPGMTGADTPSLRDAVFSAASGDLILVRPGTYEGPVEVLNKSVRIVGTGGHAGAVIVNWTGAGATISARNATLGLENIRIERGPNFVYPKTEPGGAVYAIASALTMRKVELESSDQSSPPLIVEQGDKPARVAADDSRLISAWAGMLVRGPVKVKLTRVTFESTSRPLAAWIDSAIELVDCRFLGTGAEIVINAYEGARVTVTGKQKPRINTVRGAESTPFEESFGAKRVAMARGGFARDIFRRGRRAGTLP